MRYTKDEISLYKRTIPSTGQTVYYYRVYTPEGKRIRLSTGKSRKVDARNYVNELIASGNLIPDDKRETTFNSFTKTFFVWGECSYVQRKLERSGITKAYIGIQRGNVTKHLQPQFGKMKLTEISTTDIYDWLSSFSKREIPLSNKTANNNLNTLKVILSEAVRMGLISKNPASDVENLSNRQVSRGILSPVEVKKLLNPDTLPLLWKNDLYSYLGNLLAAVTGMRQGEIIALRTKDIFPEYIHVEHSYSKVDGLKSTKTGEIRDIPISPVVYEMLKNIIKKNSVSFLFSIDGDRPFLGRKLTDDLYSALELMEVKDVVERNIKFHSWRHFFNTTLRRNGLADSKVQRVTGHKTQEMTENYTHWEVEDLKEITSIQDGIIG